MRRYKLWIAVALWTPLIAQVPQLKLTEQPKPAANPLGNTRFPAAKALAFQVEIQRPAAQSARPQAQPAGAPAGAKPSETFNLTIVEPATPCAHVRRVKPSPATDPGMVVGPPKGFESKMPIAKGMPACDEVAR
jgi:hypothetical protein